MLHMVWQAAVLFICYLSALEAWQHQNCWWKFLLVAALLLVSFWCASQYYLFFCFQLYRSFGCNEYFYILNIGLTSVCIQSWILSIWLFRSPQWQARGGASGYAMMLPGVSFSYSSPWAGFHPTVIFLSFRTDRSGQTVQTQIRLLLIRAYIVCYSLYIFGMHYSKEKPSCSKFRVITANFRVSEILGILR